jgi:hypothetical protein
LYEKERVRNVRLNEELNLLVETVVYFRNMAIDDAC